MALDSVRVRWVPASGYLNTPEARCGHVAVSINSREVWGEEFLVVHGGINRNKDALDDLVVLQYDQEAWFTPGPAAVGPAARAFHSSAVIDRKLYIFGGHVYVKQQHKLHQFNDLWVLNTDTWEWSRVECAPDAPQPCPRDRAAMVALGPNRLLLYGGADAMNRRLDDLWLFDLEEGAWREVRPAGARPRARCCTALVAVENRVLMFGGDTYGINNELWSLRGVLEGGDGGAEAAPAPQWTLLQLDGPPPPPRRGHAAAAVGRWVVFMGGLTEQKSMLGIKSRNEYLADVVVLDRGVERVSWRGIEAAQAGDAAPLAREKHSLTALAGGRLLMFGGTDGQTTLGDAWWLDLEDIAASTPHTLTAADLPPPPFGMNPEAQQQHLQQQQAQPQQPQQQLERVYYQPVAQPAPSGAAPSPGTDANTAQQAQHDAAGTAQQAPSASGSFSYLPAAISTSLPAVMPSGISNAFSSLRERLGLPPTSSTSSLTQGGPAAAGGSGSSTAGAQQLAPLQPAPYGPYLYAPPAVAAAAAAPYGYPAGGAYAAGAAAGAAGGGLQPSLPGLGGGMAADAEADEGLLALGERALLSALGEGSGEAGSGGLGGAVEEGGWEPAQLVQAARHFLAACRPEDLRIGELPVLMADYRRLARVGWAMALRERGVEALLAQQQQAPAAMPGRFLHLAAEDLRMREVPDVLADYQLLLASQTPDTGL